MGTSTNYAGSPNWGAAKSEATRAGGEGHVTDQKAASIVSAFVGEMVQAPQLGFGTPLASTPGGRASSGLGGGGGGGGGTHRIGGSARAIARGIASFLADVGMKGFREALAERGLTDISGKSPDEIALALADVLGGPSSLIEQTALRDALMALMLAWSEGVKGLDGLAASVAAAAQNIETTLHQFFGHYIFEVFKTVGYQGVLAKHGFEKAERMVGQIRDFIDAKISCMEASRPLSSVDWNGAAGATLVNEVVNDITEVFGEAKP